jgi:hypothetical protein
MIINDHHLLSVVLVLLPVHEVTRIMTENDYAADFATDTNTTISLPPGVEVPPGIPVAAVAYLQAHLMDVYGPMVFG